MTIETPRSTFKFHHINIIGLIYIYFFSVHCTGKMPGMCITVQIYMLQFKIVTSQRVHCRERWHFFLHIVINSSLKYKNNTEWKAVLTDGSFQVILDLGLHTQSQQNSFSLSLCFSIYFSNFLQTCILITMSMLSGNLSSHQQTFHPNRQMNLHKSETDLKLILQGWRLFSQSVICFS